MVYICVLYRLYLILELRLKGNGLYLQVVPYTWLRLKGNGLYLYVIQVVPYT